MDVKARIKPQNGAELVVRSLEAHGVAHVFGIPGAKIDAVFNALDASSIETVPAPAGTNERPISVA